MKRVDILKRAARNLRQAKGRTLLTSLAIAVGAFTMTLVMGAGEGLRQYADNLLKSNIDPQALYISKDDMANMNEGGSMKLREYSEDNVEGYRPGSVVKMMTRDDVATLQRRNDLKEVVPFYSLMPTYTQFEGDAKKYAASLTYYDSTVMGESVEGALPKLGQQIRDTDVLIPEEYASDIKVSPKSLIGKKVSITFTQSTQAPTEQQLQQALNTGGQAAVTELTKPKTKTYELTVAAVIKKPAMAIMSNPRLQVSTNTAKAMTEFAEGNSKNAGQTMGVSALAIGDPEKVKEALKKDHGFSVQTAKDAQKVLFSFINVLQYIAAGFAALALVASVFGIINTQYISVLERTSQIGLMKALGMSRSGVGSMFRYEAAWIGFLGGVIGATLAVLIGLLTNPTISQSMGLGANSLFLFQWWHVVAMIVLLMVIAVLAGWFPAQKAAKLDPIEALRTE